MVHRVIARVAGALGEAQALLDQARADAAPARPRVDEQQAQLGDVVLAAHAQHAARGLAVDLGDPRGLAARVVVARRSRRRSARRAPRSSRPSRTAARRARRGAARSSRGRRGAGSLRTKPAAGGACVSTSWTVSIAATRRCWSSSGSASRTAPISSADRRSSSAKARGALLGEADALAAGVVGRALAGDQAVALQAREQAAEEAGVDVHLAAQVGHLGDLALAELVEDARLGQRVRRAQQAVAQDADARGVEAVEGADGGDAVFGHRLPVSTMSLSESTIGCRARPGPRPRCDRAGTRGRRP